MQVDAHGTYFGCVVGRVANRIAGASFTLPGRDDPVSLEANDSPHALHGGSHHWGKKVWDMEEGGTPEQPAVCLTLLSENGDAGYPGEVKAQVIYTLAVTDGSPVLSVEMTAQSDALTLVNMVQHTYWNLAGKQRVAAVRIAIPAHGGTHGADAGRHDRWHVLAIARDTGQRPRTCTHKSANSQCMRKCSVQGVSIHDHQVWLNSSSITEVQDDLIPTGMATCLAYLECES